MTIEKETKTLHYFIVADASGSMGDQIEEVRMELNNHFKVLKEKAAETGDTVKVSLITFDTRIQWKLTGVLAHDLPVITERDYRAGGMTALFDAVGTTIHKAAYQVGSFDPEKESVWVMVFSDGGENASHEFKGRHLKALLKEYQEKAGWTVTFTGCDISGLEDMKAMNFRMDRTRDYQSYEKAKAFSDLNQTYTSFLEKRMSSFDFKKPSQDEL
jgi:uncharacterized protein YegL